MQQRQPRLGDILDDYCPRERRLTNHAVVAMIGDEVKQTRCTTCDADHEYKHAKVPRQRRKSDTPAALYAHPGSGGPKRVPHEPEVADGAEPRDVQAQEEVPVPGEELAIAALPESDAPSRSTPVDAAVPVDSLPHASNGNVEAIEGAQTEDHDENDNDGSDAAEEGPVHRPLIRATLPRQEGQPPPTRPAPDFTIRQPAGRQNRFRPRHQRGGEQFFGNRSNGNMGGGGGNSARGGVPRQGGGRPPQGSLTPRAPRRQGPGPGRKRSK
jgi:hypothetical protein